MSEEYQLCPLCQGQGRVSKPPWIAGDQQTWVDTQTSHVCHICNGVGIILKPKEVIC